MQWKSSEGFKEESDIIWFVFLIIYKEKGLWGRVEMKKFIYNGNKLGSKIGRMRWLIVYRWWKKKDILKGTLRFLAWDTGWMEVLLTEMGKWRGRDWRSVLDMINFKCLWVIYIRDWFPGTKRRKYVMNERVVDSVKFWELQEQLKNVCWVWKHGRYWGLQQEKL